MKTHTFDFLVIGSGIAGMSSALFLAKQGSVALVSKSTLLSGSTLLAQGGIALSEGADTESHFADTMRTGHFLNDEKAVRMMIAKIPIVLDFLEKECGAVFDADRHREGGHSIARIFHCADHTGRILAQKLAEKVRSEKAITVFEHTFAVDLLVNKNTVFGATLAFSPDKTEKCFARKTVLATGGAGQIFLATTNPIEATGDGIAMAIRAGAQSRHLEFVQFHPTALKRKGKKNTPLPLLSEALRGAGAKIVEKNGAEICDPLLPRDVVSRLVFLEQKAQREVFLDLRHRPNSFWKAHFPEIFGVLSSEGFSPEETLIPIVPTAHFFCGGVATDINGKTNLAHLFAVGEVAESGIHGSNRLASNSLLEAVAFAHTIADTIAKEKTLSEKIPDFPRSDFFPETEADAEIRRKIQHSLFHFFGIIRKPSEMRAGREKLEMLHPIGTETQNMLLVAKALADAAMARSVSIGTHLVEQE